MEDYWTKAKKLNLKDADGCDICIHHLVTGECKRGKSCTWSHKEPTDKLAWKKLRLKYNHSKALPVQGKRWIPGLRPRAGSKGKGKGRTRKGKGKGKGKPQTPSRPATPAAKAKPGGDKKPLSRSARRRQGRMRSV